MRYNIICNHIPKVISVVELMLMKIAIFFTMCFFFTCQIKMEVFYLPRVNPIYYSDYSDTKVII